MGPVLRNRVVKALEPTLRLSANSSRTECHPTDLETVLAQYKFAHKTHYQVTPVVFTLQIGWKLGDVQDNV